VLSTSFRERCDGGDREVECTNRWDVAGLDVIVEVRGDVLPEFLRGGRTDRGGEGAPVRVVEEVGT
jgi:hypothetical protein